MEKRKIGIVIADDMEYKPLLSFGGKESSYYGREEQTLSFVKDDREIELVAVCCGIGKVNAATAAMYLIAKGCEMILNTGLSGGVSGVCRGELMLCNRYIEYDFDLTPLGYEKAEKPGQTYIYESDKRMLDYFKNYLSIEKVGMAVTGDRFVSDEQTRDYLIKEYAAMSCDMESAAIASVCHITGVPFLSLRKISDDAGSDAKNAYRIMNENENFDLAELLHNAVRDMLTVDEFFG